MEVLLNKPMEEHRLRKTGGRVSLFWLKNPEGRMKVLLCARASPEGRAYLLQPWPSALACVKYLVRQQAEKNFLPVLPVVQ